MLYDIDPGCSLGSEEITSTFDSSSMIVDIVESYCWLLPESAIPSGISGVTLSISAPYPQITAAVKVMRCTNITGIKNFSSCIIAPIRTNAESPSVAIRVEITVP